MLTISQLAAHAGVTVKAVRHYHAKGLLPEPERDPSGYRRYDAAAVVELIKIRALADAGVPLSQVRTLLRAGASQLTAAVDELDRRMQAEIALRQRHRERLRQLVSGDGLALPAETVTYLEQLRRIGLSDRALEVKRDSWILIAAQQPEDLPRLMSRKFEALGRSEVRKQYRDLAEALEWSPLDPRLETVADDIAAVREADGDTDGYIISTDLARLLDSVFLATAPYAARLLTMLEDRGWTGWTNVRRLRRLSA